MFISGTTEFLNKWICYFCSITENLNIWSLTFYNTTNALVALQIQRVYMLKS